MLDVARPVLWTLGHPSRCSPAYRCACRSYAYGGLPMRDSGPPVPKSFAGPPHNQRFPKGASDSSSGPSPCLPASPRNAGCTRRRCPYCPPSPGATPCGRRRGEVVAMIHDHDLAEPPKPPTEQDLPGTGGLYGSPRRCPDVDAGVEDLRPEDGVIPRTEEGDHGPPDRPFQPRSPGEIGVVLLLRLRSPGGLLLSRR